MKRAAFDFIRAWRERLAAALQPRLAPLALRWAAMPARDQRALLALATALLMGMLWWLVVAPSMQYADDARRDLESSRNDLAWMHSHAARARQAGSTGSLPPGRNLLAVVNADARQVGLNLQRFEPDGDARVRITLENAVFTDVLRWVVGLESRYGVQVEHFQAEVQAQPGIANIRLTLTVTP